jgi:hypothetical protein
MAVRGAQFYWGSGKVVREMNIKHIVGGNERASLGDLDVDGNSRTGSMKILIYVLQI